MMNLSTLILEFEITALTNDKPGKLLFRVRAPKVDPNFCYHPFEPRAWPRIFTCIMKQTIANLRVLAGKLHYVTFRVITRNITRLSKTRISH
jgi:hypothetical protein